MHTGLKVNTYDEEAFKEMVTGEHVKGGFVDDKYRMQINFNTRKSCTDFVGISLEDDSNNIVAFCGVEVFVGQKEPVGYMHCLGVPRDFRKNGHSLKAIEKAEYAVLDKDPDIVKILAVSNEVGSGIYQQAGYVVTNKGRKSENGKISQIRLEKQIESNVIEDESPN